MNPLQKSPSSHPKKIKPILVQKFASGKNRNENNILKRSTTSIKEFKFDTPSSLTKQFTRALISQHQPSKLEYILRPHCLPQHFPTTITYFFSKIKDLQSVTTLRLDVLPSYHFDLLACLKPLLMSLGSLKNLSNASINFYTQIGNLKLLSMVFKYLKRVKTLNDLTITFWESPGLSISHIDILSSGISKLHRLRSLSLSFCYSFRHADYLIDQLALKLPRLHSLTKVEIFLNDSGNPNDIEISTLFSCFKRTKSLSEISLGIHPRQIDTEKEEPISKGLALLDHSKIRKINLNVPDNFDDSCLLQLSRTLINFTSLHTLHLGFLTSTSFQEEGITALVSSLSSLVSLSSLSVNFNLKHSDKDIVSRISIPFKYLKHLVNLNLEFEADDAEIDHEEIEELFSNLKFLKSLKFLALSFVPQGINDKNLETLAESLKELPLLEDLSLDLNCQNQFTNNGIETFASGILTLINLSSFKLWLHVNNNLDKKAIQILANLLKKLPRLYSIDFWFFGCQKVTSFDDLLAALKQTKSIGEIGLHIPKKGTKNQESVRHYLMETKVCKRMNFY